MMKKLDKLIKKCCLTAVFLGLIITAYASDNTATSWHAFPETAKSPSAAKLLIERRVPKSITPGENYDFYIKVANQSLYKMDNVILIEEIPSNFSFESATPAPSVRGNTLTWVIGMMAPRQKETIKVTGKAFKPGKIKHSGKAVVTYDLGNMTTVMDVIQANLNAEITNPKDVVVSNEIPVQITLKNLGTADVEDARLQHTFAKGLTTTYGSSKLDEMIGNIAPNGTKTVNFSLKADKAGKYSEKLVVKGKNNVQASVALNVTVGMPRLVVAANAPKKRFVGNNIVLTMNVSNKGDGIARNAVVKLDVPSNVKFINANEGGSLKAGQVVWDLGSLGSGKVMDLKAVLVGEKISVLSTTATATAEAANTVISKFVTEIAGIPALLITLSDVNDPVPIGGTETYNIKISNQGSLSAKDVVVKCKLEDSMKLVGVKGPTGQDSFSKELNQLTLKPLTNLNPGDSATWNVTVQAVKAGDVRFEVSTESRQLTRPVYENESTHFYED